MNGGAATGRITVMKTVLVETGGIREKPRRTQDHLSASRKWTVFPSAYDDYLPVEQLGRGPREIAVIVTERALYEYQSCRAEYPALYEPRERAT